MDPYTANLLGALAVGYADAQSEAMASAGLDSAELAALLAVHARPGSRVDDVALTTGLTHSGAVRVVDRLSQANWVERRAGTDGRTVAIHCSREGQKKARLALASRDEALEKAVEALTSSERAALRRLATKLLARLPGRRPDAWRICRHCDHAVCVGPRCPVGSAVP